MSVFHYEPFYDFDRFLEDVFVPRAWTGGEQQPVQRRVGGSDTAADGAVRALKPRFVPPFFLVILLPRAIADSTILQDGFARGQREKPRHRYL